MAKDCTRSDIDRPKMMRWYGENINRDLPVLIVRERAIITAVTDEATKESDAVESCTDVNTFQSSERILIFVRLDLFDH